MIITILDGYTLNPGGLSWAPLEQFGECRIYDRSNPDEVLARSADADILLTNKALLPGAVIERLPNLKYIGVLATGTNSVDLDAARRCGIPVTNVPAYGTDSVAQLVFAHLLHFARNVARHASSVHEGAWTRAKDFSYWESPLIELSGLTMGIVGYGRIGRRTAQIAEAFGMKVIACGRPGVPPPESTEETVTFVELDELFSTSDVVTLHCPLTPETRNIVNARRLGLMKQSAFLINTSRGALVDEPALASALERGTIAGAGLDVLTAEPPPASHPLLAAPNCSITPHIAWATHAARQRLLLAAAANIRAFLSGSPVNVVNGWQK